MSIPSVESEKLQKYERMHLPYKFAGAEPSQKIEALLKRDRSKWMQFALNLFAIAFFTYSIISGISQLSISFLIALIVIFSLNMVLIFVQKRQIRILIDYYSQKDAK